MVLSYSMAVKTRAFDKIGDGAVLVSRYHDVEGDGVCMCVCVCLCVRERGAGRWSERELIPM